MQKTTIIGHIGKDATVNDLGTNQVINFSVAVSESYTNKTTNEKVTKTTWYECAKWGNNTAVAQYLKKGTQVYVEGTPTARAWQNEQGQVIPVLGITVFDLKLLSSGKTEDNSSATQPHNSNHSTKTPSPNQPNPAPMANNQDEPDDLPF